ncbi:MAG: putative glycoside hydrolase [Candidatus Margulisiibacteriota bacterium]|jgi:hypothetical protein
MKKKPAIFFLLIISASFLLLNGCKLNNKDFPKNPSAVLNNVAPTVNVTASPKVIVIPVTHLPTPEAVKGIYLTSWVASDKAFRHKRVVRLVEETELNTIVLDVKDNTGRVAFAVESPTINKVGSVQKRIPDIREFIADLHKNNIYVIARISVFQDPYYVSHKPSLAVKRASDGAIWKDRGGQSWVDPGSKEIWDYIVAIAREAYAVGFDEINLDYVRFVSDGNLKDVAYPISTTRDKTIVMEDFFKYVHGQLKPEGMVLSADLFGLTMEVTHNMNIGQVLEVAAPYFDYICPMVYPSHYPYHWNGHARPATVPYAIVKKAMDRGVQRLASANITTCEIRPWLQDFNMGAIYTPQMVRTQIQAAYDAGLDSWLIWNPMNKYTRAALKPDLILAAKQPTLNAHK